VYRAYQDGFTVVINHVHRRSAAVGQLCRSLQVALHHPVGANLYLTPAGAQGFRPHVDTHDVLIAQLHGTKEWHVSDPTVQLPLAQRKPGRQPLVGARTYELHPGDTFYLPRGYLHEAVTARGSSLHLTIGIHAFRWLDVLAEALDIWAEDDIAPRTALPPGFLDQELDPQKFVELADHLRAALADPTLAERAKARIGSRLVAGDIAAEHGRFGSLDAVAALTDESRVARPPEVLALVRTTEDAATVEFAGNFVTGPVLISPALKYIAEHGEFMVRQLPGELSTQDRIDLVARLIGEGLLEVKFP
jgi:bifunctional lysine-specific demethylase and histidyl-hydroxylase NO66